MVSRTCTHVAAGLAACLLATAAAQAPGADRPALNGALTVQQAVEAGLRNSPTLQSAAADVRAAGAQARAARAMTGPQVSANTYLTTGDMTSVVPGSPGVLPENYNLAPSKGAADQNVMLMAPLYTGGRLGSLVRAADRQTDAATADEQAARQETALRIRLAYYRALFAGETLKAARAREQADTAALDVARTQFEAGKGIEASVRRVEAERADAQRMSVTAEAEQARALLDLKAAMGIDLDSKIELADTLAFAAPERSLPEYLAAASARPELRAARARAASARSQSDAARAASQPQVYGTAMADGFLPYRMRGGAGYTVGVTMSLPIFDSGQRRSETAAARAMQDRAEAQVREVELQVANEVRQTWLDLDAAAQNYRSAQAAVTAARAAYDVMVLRVQNQKAILVEQLDALAALTQARANLAQSLADHASARARLLRAVGSE